MTRPSASLTEVAAARLSRLRNDQLGDAERSAVVRCLIDFIGCCATARGLPIADTLERYIGGDGHTDHSRGIDVRHHVPADVAAFGNAVLGHSLIREDMHVASGSHIGVLVIPTLLSLAERDRLSGRDLMTGIVAGYEMAGWLGTSVWQSGVHNRHFRPSGITGPFGAAAGAATASRLDEARTAQALGFAANLAGGLNQWAWSGSQEIFLHAGEAARGGLQSFDLAKAGFTASRDVLEGRDGLFAAFGCGETAASIFERGVSADGPACILGVRHKPVAGCNFVQSAVASALAARSRLTGSEAVEGVTILTFEEARRYPGCDSIGPFDSVQQTKMSLQFGVCAALAFGRVDEATFTMFRHPEMLRLLERTRIEIDPALAVNFPPVQGGGVELAMRDGSTVRHEVADVPWLPGETVIARFRDAMDQRGAAERGERILKLLDTLWEDADCEPLFSAIAGATIGALPAR